MAPAFAGLSASSGLGPTLRPRRSPSMILTLQARRQIFKRSWLNKIRFDSALTFARPLQQAPPIPLRALDHAEPPARRCRPACAPRRASPVAVRSSRRIFFLRTRFGRGCCCFGRRRLLPGPGNCLLALCRPVAMCGSMPIFSNSSTASLLSSRSRPCSESAWAFGPPFSLLNPCRVQVVQGRLAIGTACCLSFASFVLIPPPRDLFGAITTALAL